MNNLEMLRRHYEMRVGKRISDSHWWKIRKRLKDSQLDLTETNLDHYLEISKLCPRYATHFQSLLTRIRAFNEFLGKNPQMTGNSFCYYLKTQGVDPDRSTVSRWFSNVGGFRKDRVYNFKELSIISVPAFLYLSKKEFEKANG